MNRSASAREEAATGERGALQWAVLQRTGDASANHLLIVMGWRGNRTFECYMSVATMARETGLSIRTVRRKIPYLIMCGCITEIGHPDGNRRRTKLYRLNAQVVEN